jgi:hypothetical protein
MRGDRVLISGGSLLGDARPRAGVVVAFTELEGQWHAALILDEPTDAGTALISVEPHSVTWLPPDVEAAMSSEWKGRPN